MVLSLTIASLLGPCPVTGGTRDFSCKCCLSDIAGGRGSGLGELVTDIAARGDGKYFCGECG